jgi:hypothetical protein
MHDIRALAECLAPARLHWQRQESGDGVRTLPLSFFLHFWSTRSENFAHFQRQCLSTKNETARSFFVSPKATPIPPKIAVFPP